jgi:hypothetical protein
VHWSLLNDVFRVRESKSPSSSSEAKDVASQDSSWCPVGRRKANSHRAAYSSGVVDSVADHCCHSVGTDDTFGLDVVGAA